MIQFYYATNSCSLGIRVLLEELGLAYEAHRIDFASKQQFTPEYRAVNPKGKVPALVREDGSLLTEFQTIAFWLARSHPEAGLIGADLEAQTRTLELLDFIVGSVHMRGFTFVAVPAKFSPNEQTQKDLVAHGLGQIEIGFARLAEVLDGKDWLTGRFGPADCALFYLTCWAVQGSLAMPAALAAHHNRMLERPAAQRALKGEGLADKVTRAA